MCVDVGMFVELLFDYVFGGVVVFGVVCLEVVVVCGVDLDVVLFDEVI